MQFLKQQLYQLLGWSALILGAVGVVVPLLPTTPFVLLAAFFFSRSSESLHRRLREHRVFGPMLRDWETHGVIAKRAKWTATVMMLVIASYSLVFGSITLWSKLLLTFVICCVLIYIWTRPSVAVKKV